MQSPLDNPIFELIGKTADEMNINAWVVGGFVRDSILKRENKDIDIVVVGNGVEFAQAVARKLDNDCSLSVFKNFGTAQIKFDDWIIEFIGARKESYRRDSRKPMVENGTLEDDQNRRDFTINAMYLSLNAAGYGELYDPFNGVQDLQNGIIKTCNNPDVTFDDDPLRMLRAIRFASRLNFRIELKTFEAIKRNIDRIEIVSQERITDELNGMILGEKPSRAFEMMSKTGLLTRIFPEMMALQGVETRNGKSHKDNFYHTLQVLDNICEFTDNLWLRWAAILHDIAKPATKRFDPKVGWTFHGHEDRGSRMVKGIFKKMRLPLDEKMRYVSKLVLLHLRPIVLSKETVTDSAVRRLIVDAGEHVTDLVTLCRADITSKNEAKVEKHLRNLVLVQEKINEVLAKDELRNWQPVLTGNHIKNHFDIKDPQDIGRIKEAIRELILDGQIPNELPVALTKAEEIGLSLGITTRQ
ncbi:MAG: HD domain-containing protein [Bacteroidia bacterium]|nr:HD domain-containing protein [Bacteroidia bacterium]